MSDTLSEIHDSNFDTEVIQAERPTLVDFWAEWCAPCRALSPIVAEIAETYKGRLNVTTMNIDDQPLTPVKYGVRSIPTLILFKNGQVEDQSVGLTTKAQLEEMLDKHV